MKRAMILYPMELKKTLSMFFKWFRTRRKSENDLWSSSECNAALMHFKSMERGSRGVQTLHWRVCYQVPSTAILFCHLFAGLFRSPTGHLHSFCSTCQKIKKLIEFFLIPSSILGCIFLFSQLEAIPWGNDATLARAFCERKKNSSPSPSSSSFSPFHAFIRFHQTIISPVDGPRSSFVPGSSQYMYDAINRYGTLLGVLKGFDRLLRENNDPWVYRLILTPRGWMKYDPA